MVQAWEVWVNFKIWVFRVSRIRGKYIQGFPSVPQDQEMPQVSKATIADVRLALIMKSQIRLPVRMNMNFTE